MPLTSLACIVHPHLALYAGTSTTSSSGLDHCTLVHVSHPTHICLTCTLNHARMLIIPTPLPSHPRHLAHRPSLWGCAGAFVCTCWHACCASVPAEACAGGLACLGVLAAGTSVRAGMSFVRACASVW